MTREPTAPAPSLLRSGRFRLDTGLGRLSGNGAPVELGGLPLHILEILMRKRGEVVTRAELKRQLWPHAVRIDVDRRLNTAMRALRRALGEDAGTPMLIETLRGRGYRWIGHQVRPPARPAFWWAAAGLALFVLTTSNVRSESPVQELSAAEQARFVEIAAIAGSQPDAALVLLDAFIADRPDHAAAHLLRSDLALRLWREAPTAGRLTEARTTLAVARTAVGGQPDIDVMAADLALAAEWDWREAEQLYRRAIAQDPGHLDAHAGLAWLYANAGRTDEVWAQIEPLLRSAELTESRRADLGWLLLRLGRDESALAICDGAAGSINLLACRHTALARLGRIAEARQAALALLNRVDAGREAIDRVAGASPAVGYRHFLEWQADHFLPDGASTFQQAQLAAAAGRLDDALRKLEQAFAERDPLIVKIGSTPEFDRLAQAPRFRRMLAAVRAGRHEV